MRPAMLVLVALVAISGSAAPAAALRVPAPAPPADGLGPGDVVTTRIPALPAGAREFELVLLPDGGEPVALGPELPAGVREVTWRVPRTYASRARLLLRAGTARGEWRSEPSAAFALAPPSPAELIRLVTGGAEARAWVECWSPDAGAIGGDPGRDSLARGSGGPNVAEPPAAPGFELPAGDCAAPPRRRGACAPPAAPATRVATSRFTPLRN